VFTHVPASSLRSVAIQALCTGHWLRPTSPTHGALAASFLPAQLEALTRSLHRVLAWEPEELMGLTAPTMDAVNDMLVGTAELPDTIAGLLTIIGHHHSDELTEALDAVTRLLAGPGVVDHERLRAACQHLLVLLMLGQP
jgi:hypothetical protein